MKKIDKCWHYHILYIAITSMVMFFSNNCTIVSVGYLFNCY